MNQALLNDSQKNKNVKNIFILILVAWSIIVSASFFWNMFNEQQQTMRLAHKDAIANFNKDQAFRLWASSHGGVYVPVTEKTPPNKHLSHLKERDISTPSGKQLTLMNPAYMVRQMMDDYSQLYGIKGRIVSTKPFNKNNTPDSWEHKALKHFEQGSKEITEISTIDDIPYLRIIRPMVTQKGCLKCHGFQGYQVDDIRGGVGVSISLQPYFDEQQISIIKFFISHALIWLIGLAGISIFYIRTKENAQREAHTQTELLQLRHYLKNVFDSMPSILVGVNQNGLITHWNHEAERITEQSSSAVEGKVIDSVIPLLQKHMPCIKKAIEENTPQKMERIPHNDNNKQHFSDIIIYPLVMNEQVGAVIRIDDITERIHIEEMMIQTEKMLSVGGLAAGMAHEINNPLGGIMQGQQNIQRRLLPDMEKNQRIANKYGIDLNQLQHYLEDREILHFLDEIGKAGKRASTIVVNMLQFSRKASNKKETVNILEVIDLVLKLASMDYDLKKKYDFRSIEIVRDYANKLPLIYCVASEIQQVLLNVFRNSAQSMHATDKIKFQSRLSVHVYKVDQYISIDIEDNGCGMDKESSRRIFEPFYTTKDPGIGTGLGMSVSYFIIVETHGGEMFIESEQEKGTKIIIRLPI